MAKKRLLIDKYYWGISNDPNIWGVWAVHYAEWVEIREDSKKVTLAKWTPGINYMWTSTSYINGYEIVDQDNFLRIHNDWIITNALEKNVFWQTITWNIVVNIWEWLYNIGSITTPVNKYWFIFWATKVYKWVYNASSPSLWIYNTSWIVDNPEFNSTWTWTINTGWAFSWWLATHTPWNTWTLDQTLTTDNTQVYRVKIKCWTITADSCAFQLWWVSQYTFNNSDSWKTKVLLYTATWTSTLLSFVPFSNFNWSFESVDVYKYNITTQSKTFTSKSPYIIINNFIYVWNGNKVVEIDTTSSVWVYTDVLSIDLDFLIKWITKIWDQVFIYASNWNSSRQYLWNWVDTTVTRTITWVDKNVVNVANFANQDYIITKSAFSNKSGLYLVNWYSLEKIFENTQNNDTTQERIFFDASYTNAIETIGNKLIIPWVDGLYSYGKHTPWLPVSLVKEYLHNAGITTALSYSEMSEYQMKIASVWTYGGITWIWETSINFYNISYPTTPEYSWFLVLEPLFGTNFSNIKTFEKITAWYELWTWCQILVYSKNWNDSTNYANIACNYTTLPTVWSTYTFNSNTFTITNVTDLWDYCILHTTYTWTGEILTKWTFTKASWTGDNSIISNKIRYWYKYINTINNIDTYRETINMPDDFHKKYIAFELVNTNIWFNPNTPALYDSNLYYNENNDD